MTMIYIGNLSNSIDTARTRSLFEDYGDILSIRITAGIAGRRFDNSCLVEMGESAAKKAIEELDGRLFEGAILSVREAAQSQLPNTASAALRKSSGLPDAEASW